MQSPEPTCCCPNPGSSDSGSNRVLGAILSSYALDTRWRPEDSGEAAVEECKSLTYNKDGAPCCCASRGRQESGEDLAGPWNGSWRVAKMSSSSKLAEWFYEGPNGRSHGIWGCLCMLRYTRWKRDVLLRVRWSVSQRVVSFTCEQFTVCCWRGYTGSHRPVCFSRRLRSTPFSAEQVFIAWACSYWDKSN